MNLSDKHPIPGGTHKLVLYIAVFIFGYYYWPIRFYREDGSISSRVLVSMMVGVGLLVLSLQVPTGGWANWLRAYWRRNAIGYYERLTFYPATQTLERLLVPYFGDCFESVADAKIPAVLYLRISGWLGNRRAGLLITNGRNSAHNDKSRLHWRVFPQYRLSPSKSPHPGFREWCDVLKLVQTESGWEVDKERSECVTLVVTPEQCLKLVELFTNKDGTLLPLEDVILERLKLRKAS